METSEKKSKKMSYKVTPYNRHESYPEGMLYKTWGEFRFVSNSGPSITLFESYNPTYSNGYIYYTSGGSTHRINAADCVSQRFKSDWEFCSVFSYENTTLLVGDDQIIGVNGLRVMELKSGAGVTHRVIDANDYVILVCKTIANDNLDTKAYVYVYDCDSKKILKSNLIPGSPYIDKMWSMDRIKAENYIIHNGMIHIGNMIIDTDTWDADVVLEKCTICKHKVYLPQTTELGCEHKIHDTCARDSFIKCPQHSALGWFYK